MSSYSAASKFLKPRSKTNNMATAAYDNWVEPYLSPEVAPPPLQGAAWLLGRDYLLPQDKSALHSDVHSRLWFTYRKNFKEIGGTQYTSDTGWGCTLRCGQMMLAQALLCLHLGRDWVWEPTCNSKYRTYMKILRMFLDSRDSIYSIQHIALQGADFGREVGQWFGPNNVAQAIKRLSLHDSWNKLAVYVAMDMLVIIDDIKNLCKTPYQKVSVPVSVTTMEGHLITSSLADYRFSRSDPSINDSIDNEEDPSSAELTDTRDQATLSTFAPSSLPVSRSISSDRHVESSMLQLSMNDAYKANTAATKTDEAPCPSFRPLLLFIPLRLGQEKFNMEYASALKACFAIPQSVGIIGGRPRHALWLIGCNEDTVFYLDPHTTQQAVQVPDGWFIPDSTYHVQQPDHMHLSDLDPSLALGFICKSEAEFDDLCVRLRQDVLSKMSYMFELTEKRPAYWGAPETSLTPKAREPFVLLDSDQESDEGFELVNWPPVGGNEKNTTQQ